MKKFAFFLISFLFLTISATAQDAQDSVQIDTHEDVPVVSIRKYSSKHYDAGYTSHTQALDSLRAGVVSTEPIRIKSETELLVYYGNYEITMTFEAFNKLDEKRQEYAERYASKAEPENRRPRYNGN